MKMMIRPEQLAGSPELQQLANYATALGTKVYWLSGTAEYIFDTVGTSLVSKEAIQLCLSKGVLIVGGTFYSPIVPRTTLNNKVTDVWPSALRYVEEEDKYVTMEWQECCRVYDQGVDNCVIEYRRVDSNGNGPELSGEDFVKLIAKFGGFQTQGEFSEWKEVIE